MSPKFNVGDLTVHRIIEQETTFLPARELFPQLAPDLLAQNRDWMRKAGAIDENDTLILCFQSYVVRTPHHTILIDSCIGNDKSRPLRPKWNMKTDDTYMRGLKAAGLSVEDIDFVMCTHLHVDHVGWNTRMEGGRWVPTFPKARYLMGKTEVEHFAREAAANAQANHGSYQDSVLPVIERGLATLAQPNDEIIDGGRLLSLPGHTPGQIGLELDDGQEGQIVFCGDAIHSPAQVILPDLSTRVCSDKALAAQTRRKLIERAVAEDLRLIPGHLRGSSMRVRAEKTGFVPVIAP